MICSESTRAFGHPRETNPTFGIEAVGAAGVEVCDIENGPARAMSDAIVEGLGVQPGRRNRGKRGCTVRRCPRGEDRREMGPCGSCGKSIRPAQATSDYTVRAVKRRTARRLADIAAKARMEKVTWPSGARLTKQVRT